MKVIGEHMDNKDIDSLYANLQDEIKKVLEDWWQKIKWNVENAASSAAQSATTAPTRRSGSLPWFGHGIRGFLHKLWYGDHPENPNWRAMPATENSRKRMTVQEYTVLKEQLENWIDIFAENDLISTTKNDLLNGLLGVMSKYINHAYQLGYTRNNNAPATDTPPAQPDPTPTSPAAPAASEPTPSPAQPEPEPTPGFDPPTPPQGQAADMPRRGRGRPQLSPDEKAARKALRKQNKMAGSKPPVAEPTSATAPSEPTTPPVASQPETPPTAPEPASNNDIERQNKIQELLPFFGNLRREPEAERIANRQKLYDQLGLEHDSGQLRSKPAYIPIIGDIVHGMIKDEYLEKKYWNSGERYKRIFGPLKGEMIDKIVAYVEKKIEDEDNPQTNANLSGVAANPSNESLQQKVNRYKNLLKENKQSTLTIVKARKLTKDEKLSYFKESLK